MVYVYSVNIHRVGQFRRLMMFNQIRLKTMYLFVCCSLKRKGDTNTNGTKKVKMVDVEENFVVEENLSGSSEDESTAKAPPASTTKRSPGGTLKVKWTAPAKKKNVIVIDSGSESESESNMRPDSPAEKKPDVDKLNEAMEKSVNRQIVSPKVSEPGTSMQNSIPNGQAIATSVVHQSVQTDAVIIKPDDSDDSSSSNKLQTEFADNKAKLQSLRHHVSELLKSILPDLTVDNVEDIDKIVVEMVRVNAEEGGASSSQLLSPKKGTDASGS